MGFSDLVWFTPDAIAPIVYEHGRCQQHRPAARSDQYPEKKLHHKLAR